MVAVVVIGIMIGAASQSWRTITKRDREEELLFRGTQIRDAIAKWQKPRIIPGYATPQPAPPLRDLKDLLQDPTTPETKRYLRRLYTDPITGKDFEVISDAVHGIIGVKSTSQDPPLKRGNFPDDLKTFADKDKYSDWQFNYLTPANQPGAQRPGGIP